MFPWAMRKSKPDSKALRARPDLKALGRLRAQHIPILFLQFEKLPAEVRMMIWILLFPAGRRVPIDILQPRLPCFQPPVTHAINRESRLLTMEHYSCIPWNWVSAPLKANPSGGMWFYFDNSKPVVRKPFWLDPQRDFVTMQYSTLVRNTHFERVYNVVLHNLVWCNFPWILSSVRIFQLLDVSLTELSKGQMAKNSFEFLKHLESLKQIWLVREKEFGSRRMHSILLYQKNVQGMVAALKALKMRGRLEKLPRIIADGNEMLEEGLAAWV